MRCNVNNMIDNVVTAISVIVMVLLFALSMHFFGFSVY
ncbi:hypothetical protein Aci022_001 [Acinetobacter phage vB_AbaM_B09_Aci02-2]|uniref:Uncharacterized protein n=1 Tax=Acinetobacter phage vB_AbaM_B09_Aci02-2 TaxID=2315467 RepID=A0A386KJQ3_9CAUD|nr:hypothetical protein HOU30_gp001 [Acinetobacter phage vB_AbaM_B09_Aci02-2]AYD85855.1 hypothetical protein Aci022_001 [Acinetobacter phage vB_AbaM_B09_Aci02-2]